MKFESKADLQYDVKRYSINRNQHFIVVESELDMWAVKCKKGSEGCNWRLCACCRKTKDLFEITKHIGPHTCVEILSLKVLFPFKLINAQNLIS